MSNELTEYCQLFRICPIKAMNLLQDDNLISDNCITTDDVAPVDCDRSIRYVKLNRDDLRPNG